MKYGNYSELSVLRAFLEATYPKEKVGATWGTKRSTCLHTRFWLAEYYASILILISHVGWTLILLESPWELHYKHTADQIGGRVEVAE